MFQSRWAKEVTVFDHTCDDWRKCYKNSGIEAAKACRCQWFRLTRDHITNRYRCPTEKLTKTQIHESIVNCDKWINVRVLKNHGGAQLTISMKKLHGHRVGQRFFMPMTCSSALPMCTLRKRPVLNVVDAYRMMKTRAEVKQIGCGVVKGFVPVTGHRGGGYCSSQLL